MATYQTILFDVDGTLADNFEGIQAGVLYALEQLGIHEQNPASIRRFVGPPLWDSFKMFYGLNAEQAEEGVQQYRVYFRETGVNQVVLYDGVVELLKQLKQAGYKLATASSKPEIFVRKILTQHGIIDYFDAVVGADLAGELHDKQAVCLEALRRTNTAPADAVLVGDRMFDAEGAMQCGMDFIGVLYGFGNRPEFVPFPSVLLADTADQVADFLLSSLS